MWLSERHSYLFVPNYRRGNGRRKLFDDAASIPTTDPQLEYVPWGEPFWNRSALAEGVWVDMLTDGGKGHHTATITATDQHPFWTITKRPGHKPSGHWTNATDLHAGTRLRTPTGHVATIIAMRRFVEPQAVNNLTIASLDTYM